MVAQNMLGTYEVNQTFRFAEEIFLYRKISQIRFFLATSFLRNMFWATIQYKYHDN